LTKCITFEEKEKCAKSVEKRHKEPYRYNLIVWVAETAELLKDLLAFFMTKINSSNLSNLFHLLKKPFSNK
jgi:hypothetical protein